MKEVGNNISPGSTTTNDITTNATASATAPAKKTISTHINMIISSVEHQFKGATPTPTTIDESNNNVELMEVEENITISEEMDETTRLALNDIPDLMRKELCLNEFWYVLDRHWYDSFMDFLKNQGAHPGKIDNSALLEPVKNSSSKNAESSYVLKATVSENIDFVFVAEKAWNLLVEAFGTVEGMGGYPYRCPVFRRTGSYLQLELRPLELRLTLYGSKEDMVVQYSRNCTLKQVIDDMKKLFKIDENKPVQLWNNATLLVSYNGESNVCSSSTSNNSSATAVSPSSTNSSSSVPRPPPPPPPPSSSNSQPVSSLDQCLLDIVDLEAPGTVLTIEVENNDHTWPSSKTKSGAVTRSKYASGTPNHQPGACGLMNLGNTCFMNAAIQCLSNTSPLTKYFLADQHLADLNPDNPLGMQGEIARCYADLIKLMWSGFYSSVGPREFKVAVTQFAPQFSGFAHHDCQELMAFLLDGLHEDLNRVKVKPYRMMKNDIEKRPDDVVAAEAWRNYKLRNDSIIVDTFHAQLKSTLVCPECDLVSVTFDPFCYLSLPLPYRIERSVDIIFVPAISKRPVFAKRNPCTTLTSQSGSEQNNDVAYTISVRSILLENVLIPKIGCASDISASVAKMLNDCAAEDPNQYFNRKFDPKKLVVANIMDSRLNKFLEPHTLYNSHFDDIVVYELDDLPTSTNPESGSTIQTRSSSKFIGHHLPVFLRQINADSSYSMLSRPFFINIKSLTYENIREAIFKELISIVPPEKVNSFLQAMEANLVEEENEMSAPNMMRKTKDDGSDGEASDDDEDEEMIQNNSNNTIADLDNDDEGVDTFGGIQPACNMKKCMASTYTITVVNSNAQNVSVLNPGQRLESSSDIYLAINIHYRIVSKYFPSNINRCGFIRLTSMLPNLQASNMNSVLTLKECINQFTLTEKLGENDPWYCPRCKKHQMASKKFDVWSLPDNLIIHLKRFSYSRLHRDKLNVLVEFPIENLDMSPYVLHNPNNESFVYDLIAVSNHYGELGAGHYTAYGKNFRTNSWYLFDDYSVSAVHDKNKVMTKAAYVLFYQRKPQTTSTGSEDNNSMTDSSLPTKLEDSQSVAPCE